MSRKDRRAQGARLRRRAGGGAPGADASVLFAQAGAALQSGRLPEAEALFREILRRDPRNAGAENWLGVVCQRQGKTRDAVEHLRKAVALAPASADFANNLGIAELGAGDLDAAAAALEKAVALDPALAQAHYNLGLVRQKRRELEPAIASFRRAIALAPDYVNAHLNLGNALRDSGKLEDAIAQYRKLVELAPNSPEAHYTLAAALKAAGNFDDAAEECRAALRADSRFAPAHELLGETLTVLGRLDEAVASFESALAIRPDHADALYRLTEISKRHSTAAMAARIEDLLAANPPAASAAALHFALGKVYADLGEYRKAFENYRRGNDLAVPEALFDAAVWNSFVDRIVAVFTADFFAARKGLGSDSRRPIFIVGMPRSGTTLVEQIVASHPQVAAGGELEAMADLVQGLRARPGAGAYPEGVAALDPAAIADLAAAYLAALDGIGAALPRVTDKMPLNFLYLGLIALLFPNAAYIHCRRDPLDTCLSCYFAKFGRDLDFSYRLDHLGAYYRGYRRLMAHWRHVLPVTMLDVDYEGMVADQEAQTRRLIAHCGLDWDDRCLAFQKTERAVTTASAWQVRQPLYKTSVARWRHYEPFLDPLREALGDAVQ